MKTKTQTTIKVDPKVYSEFKITCLKRGRSITSYLEELMKLCNDKRKKLEFEEFQESKDD